jgi:signal transduction histidine kinase
VEEVPVSVEIPFHHLARQVCDLLDCHAAYLLPGCPVPELRHPLLDLLSIFDYYPIGSYCPRGPVDVATLLQHEQLRALCDLAAQTGRIQSLAAFPASDATPLQSIAVIPLEQPAGLLGFFLLLDERPEAFSQGDLHLLDSYLPPLRERLEKDLRCLANLVITQQLPQLHRQREACQQPSALQGREEPDRIDNKFLSMVMHELRIPLTAIKGYTALLQAYPSAGNSATQDAEIKMAAMTPERQQQYLDTIMEQVTHLEVLVRDLLDISRIHAGRLSLRCTSFDLAQLCQRVVELLQHRVRQQEAHYDLRCVTSPDLPPVWADPDRVRQALTNLLENAVKYSPTGGLIEIYVSPQQTANVQEEYLVSSPDLPHWPVAQRETKAIQVTVRDHGIGISPEQQAHLFKPFRRLEHPQAGDVTGAGLGLYITGKLIEAMGGQVSLESREGEGTIVTFTLPISNHVSTNAESQVVYEAIAKRHPVCYSVLNTK